MDGAVAAEGKVMAGADIGVGAVRGRENETDGGAK